MSTPALPLAPLGTALPEASYTNLEAVKAALQAHARGNGYAITVKSAVLKLQVSLEFQLRLNSHGIP